MLKAVAQRVVERQPGVREAGSTMVRLEAEDMMDDGSRIKLSVTVDSEQGTAHFDFAGTGPEVGTCLVTACRTYHSTYLCESGPLRAE